MSTRPIPPLLATALSTALWLVSNLPFAEAVAGEDAAPAADVEAVSEAVSEAADPAAAVDGAAPVAVEAGDAAAAEPVALHERLQAAETRLAAAERARDQAVAERDEIMTRLQELKRDLGGVRARQGEIEAALAQRTAERDEAQTLAATQAEAIVAGRSAVAALESTLDATEGALADARASLQLREASLQEVQSLYDENAARIEVMAKQLAAAEQARGDLEARLDQGQADAQARIDELESTLRDLLKTSLIRVQTLPDRRTRVRMSADRVFAPGTPLIGPEGQAMLAEIRDTVLGGGLGTIRVEVHEDRDPGLRGGRDRDLSRARAQAVVDLLSRLTGLPESRFAATGVGDHHPVASNADPQSRALNRRVEIYLPPPSLAPSLAPGMGRPVMPGMPGR